MQPNGTFSWLRWTLRPKRSDRGYISAFLLLIVIALTCTAFAQLRWFRIRGGKGHCVPSLRLSQFFNLDGYFDATSDIRGPPNSQEFDYGGPKALALSRSSIEFSNFGGDVFAAPVTVAYYSSSGVLSCVNPHIVNLMRVVILLCAMVLVFSVTGLVLELGAPTGPALRLLRRNAVCASCVVLTIVSIIGVCYWITVQLEMAARGVLVEYDDGCYVMTAAGAVAILSAAVTLLQATPSSNYNLRHHPDELQRRHLVDWEDWDGLSVPSNQHNHHHQVNQNEAMLSLTNEENRMMRVRTESDNSSDMSAPPPYTP
uniref:Putative conserved plasma membrane protein n=1 Tax=Xenopsylla cheopis TaxID=163159 RepID=A0A6M2DPQ9_XENCH